MEDCAWDSDSLSICGEESDNIPQLVSDDTCTDSDRVDDAILAPIEENARVAGSPTVLAPHFAPFFYGCLWGREVAHWGSEIGHGAGEVGHWGLGLTFG